MPLTGAGRRETCTAGNYVDSAWGTRRGHDTAPDDPSSARGSARPRPWFIERRSCSTRPWTASRVRRSGSASTSTISPARTRARIDAGEGHATSREDVDSISFHVDEIGKPVVVQGRRTSRTGRCTARRARTALAPNLMVVVPTSARREAHLRAHAASTGSAASSRSLGLVGLVRPRRVEGPRRRYGATTDDVPTTTPTPTTSADDDGDDAGPTAVTRRHARTGRRRAHQRCGHRAPALP